VTPGEWRAALNATVESWGTGEPLSEHLRLEVAAAHHRGAPLAPGSPVPGCSCPTCTGVPETHPARRVHGRPRHDLSVANDVRRARCLSVLDVAHRLGCGDPRRRGRELRVLCPLHDDSDPSLRISADGRTWFCDPCGEGGDGIHLWMCARRVSFLEVPGAGRVKDLTSFTP
jgi:hypothetical protein